MIGTGQAASAKATRRHTEVPAVFLHHDVGGYFRCAEDGVLGLINGKGLRNPMLVSRVSVVPSCFKLLELDGIRQITVHLVGGHVNERSFWGCLSCALQKIQRAYGICIKVGEWDSG